MYSNLGPCFGQIRMLTEREFASFATGNGLGFQRLPEDAFDCPDIFREPDWPSDDGSPSTFQSTNSSTSQNFPLSSGTTAISSTDISIIVSGTRWKILARFLVVRSSWRICSVRLPCSTLTWPKLLRNKRDLLVDWPLKSDILHSICIHSEAQNCCNG